MTIPDNTKVAPGEVFVKTWRLQNSGGCTWTAGYEFVFQGGRRLGAPESVKLDRDVAPRETVDLSVTFTAPAQRGKYRSQWRLRGPDGATFGTRPYVQIRVVGTARATQPATVGPTETLPPAATQAVAPEPTQPPPTPEVVSGLEEELPFRLRGGDVTDFGHLCLQPPPGVAAPTLAGHGRLEGVAQGGTIHTEDDGVVCLYGVPSDGELAVDLFLPDGKVAGSAVFRVEQDILGGRSTFQIYPELEGPPFTVKPELAGEPIVGSAQIVDGLEVISISIWLPAGLPSGEWRIAARWKGGRVEAPFVVQGPVQPIVNPMPDRAIDPFREYRAANHAFSRGEEIRLQGTGFEADSSFPIALYHLQDVGVGDEQLGVLALGQMVSTDAGGRFSTLVQTGRLLPGTYMIVSNPDSTGYGEGLSLFSIAK